MMGQLIRRKTRSWLKMTRTRMMKLLLRTVRKKTMMLMMMKVRKQGRTKTMGPTLSHRPRTSMRMMLMQKKMKRLMAKTIFLRRMKHLKMLLRMTRK